MDLLRWMGRMFARFVAVSVIILSAWLFFVNAFGDQGWRVWVLIWILASGVAGTVGGVLYLLSLDGPARFRTKPTRIGGWAAMLAAVLLPTALAFMLVPLVLVLIPTLFTVHSPPESAEGTVTSG